MRRHLILFCQLAICCAALLMLAWFGLVCLVGMILAAPGRLIFWLGRHMLEDFDDDMTAAYEWLEARR